MKYKRLIIILVIVIFLLLIPLIAMHFTKEVNWGYADFVVAGLLLFGTGILYDLILRKVQKRRTRIILTITLLAMLLLIWAELAVGIF